MHNFPDIAIASLLTMHHALDPRIVVDQLRIGYGGIGCAYDS